MPLLNISAAARAVGRDRNTIKKYLTDGRLSSTKDSSGKVVIDTAELMRVFGVLTSDGTTNALVNSPSDSPQITTIHQPETGIHQVVEALAEQLRAAQERERAALDREEWLKKQLETEQQRSRELELKLLPAAIEEPVKPDINVILDKRQKGIALSGREYNFFLEERQKRGFFWRLFH